MLRKWTFALTAAALATNAFAAHDWISIGESDSGRWFIDTNSIQKTGVDGATYWLKIEQAKPDPDGGVTTFYHVKNRCGAPVVSFDAIEEYNEDGKVLFSRKGRTTQSAPPGSIYERAMETSCDYVHDDQ